MKDESERLDGEVIYGQDRLDTREDDLCVAAMQIGNFVDYVKEASLVITPGDRSDIIIAALASRMSFRVPGHLQDCISPPGGLEMAKCSPPCRRLVCCTDSCNQRKTAHLPCYSSSQPALRTHRPGRTPAALQLLSALLKTT